MDKPAFATNYRILCVDDEIMGTTLRGEILRERGYSVVLYHCPLAVLRCDFSVFDLAVLDFHMPGLNGRELFLRMRASGAKFPILLLTGGLEALSHDERVLFTRCFDKGMPIERLLDALSEFLDPNQIPDWGHQGQHPTRRTSSGGPRVSKAYSAFINESDR